MHNHESLFSPDDERETLSFIRFAS
jgi:hypothetical protein